MTINAAGLDSLLRGMPENPDHYLHAVDFINRRALIVRIDRSTYRHASFLDDRALNAGTEGVWVPIAEVLRCAEAIPPGRAPHYIFHLGHCGSTLLTRLIGAWPEFHVLREPLPLLALGLVKRELDTPLCPIAPPEWPQLFDAVVRFMGRTYRGGDAPVVKATSVCANLVDDALKWNAGSRLILVYVDLATCLQTMLKSEANRENSRAFAPKWLADFHRLSGGATPRLHELDDTRQITLNWIMAMQALLGASNNAPDRTMLVAFDSFLRDMETGLAAIAAFLGKDVAEDEIRALASGPAAAAYAKQPRRPYSRAMREQALAAAQKSFATEIRTGIEWGRRLIEATPALAGVERYITG